MKFEMLYLKLHVKNNERLEQHFNGGHKINNSYVILAREICFILVCWFLMICMLWVDSKCNNYWWLKLVVLRFVKVTINGFGCKKKLNKMDICIKLIK